jgi:hypothetical protein
MNPDTGSDAKKSQIPQSAYMKNLSSESVDAQVVQMQQSGASRVRQIG